MTNKLRIETDEAILIAGPTASGKSRLALDLAIRAGGEVINADSMQVYAILNVLTARPEVADLAAAPHHLYGHVQPGTAFSTGIWLAEAQAAIADVRARGRLPVVVGGTGLYFRALAGGLSDIPAIPDAIRAHWRDRLEIDGAPALHAHLALRDPDMAARLKPADRQRIVRSLEVMDATGRSIAKFQARQGSPVVDFARAQRLLLLPDRAELHRRINVRFARMVEEGALEEVKALNSKGIPPHSPAMKAIGVAQLSAVLAGKMPIEEAIDKATAATRQYAKRQMTWFRNQLDTDWTMLDC